MWPIIRCKSFRTSKLTFLYFLVLLSPFWTEFFDFLRYGTELGTATENALTTVGNTYLTAYNATALGPKALAKRAVKTTGKVAVGVSEDVILGRTTVPTVTEPENNENGTKAIEGPNSHETKAIEGPHSNGTKVIEGPNTPSKNGTKVIKSPKSPDKKL